MRARAIARALTVCLLLAGCTGPGRAPSPSSEAGTTGASVIPTGPTATGPTATGPAPTGPTLGSGPLPTLPPPDARIPPDPRALSTLLATELRALDQAIETWRRDGDIDAWPPPREVELRALHVQRVYRTLAREPVLARRTMERLPHAWRFEVRSNVSASASLFRHVVPVESAEGFRTARPEPAGVLLGWFEEAERRFGADRETLAAVMLIETRFGRIVSRSYAGASGPMQFIPSTWKAYGLGGDVRDPHDAILGAANYLRASGAPEDERRALHAYNPVEAYVDAVSSYAEVMRRDPNAFFAYYNWQVFVRTVDGDVQLTGPGA